jgi:hypothetical protein
MPATGYQYALNVDRRTPELIHQVLCAEAVYIARKHDLIAS